MPRGFLKEKEYRVNDFTIYLLGEMSLQGISQEQMAQKLGITQQAFSYKKKHRSFSHKDIITIFDYLKTPDAKILQLMKLERS